MTQSAIAPAASSAQYNEIQLERFKRLFRVAQEQSGVKAAYLIVEEQADGVHARLHSGGAPKPEKYLLLFMRQSAKWRRFSFADRREDYAALWRGRIARLVRLFGGTRKRGGAQA